MKHVPQSKQQYLRELVYEKNFWDEPLSEEDKAKGFLGWHERGYLPHCDKPGLIQFITFRLADSMPISKRDEWQHLLKIEDNKEKRTKLEQYLDKHTGSCHLRDAKVATIAEKVLLHFHKRHYELLSWCVMPNHVHVLVHIWETPLWKLIQSWKRKIAKDTDPILQEIQLPPQSSTPLGIVAPGRRPALRKQMLRWQRDYWDTFMRDKEQERRAIRYIESNPVKAKLSRLSEEWMFSSARRRDEYFRLQLEAFGSSDMVTRVGQTD